MYEFLDTIADNVNPVLLVASLLLLGFYHKERWKGYTLYLVAAIVYVYGFQAIDRAFDIWSSTGLDYSTHSAVTIAMTGILIWLKVDYWKWVVPIVLSYFGLQLFQEYHSLADIVSTSLVIMPLVFIANYLTSKRSNKKGA